MKMLLVLVSFGMVLVAGNVRADDEYTDYVKQCIQENTDQGNDQSMVETYCVCMDNLIPDGEEKTVNQWAKSHPDEDKVCTHKAGWE